ncbi:hypothetical protein AYK20_01295 [Thermoplasmatales archaeon SG8-52-1]|nr:MAG: hypothetical protein AYK20_01295 [Thermoplasmatales archaeon SG8-52-1]
MIYRKLIIFRMYIKRKILNEAGFGMEETLYRIEIHKDEDSYLGKIHTNLGSIIEFKNNTLELLLKDLINDMNLESDTYLKSTKIFRENKGEI